MSGDLTKRLRECETDYNFGLLMGRAADALEAQAKRIAELDVSIEGHIEGRIDNAKRAEKIEADLAAARATLSWVETHAPHTLMRAIAAVRGEQPKSDVRQTHNGMGEDDGKDHDGEGRFVSNPLPRLQRYRNSG